MASAFRYKPGSIVKALKSNVKISYGGKSIDVIALWDTGATTCCVSEDVVKKLSLVSTGNLRISTPSSSNELVDTYLVDLLLPNDIKIDDVVVAHSKIGAQGIGLLVGMDIISKGDFLITNNNETIFSFRMPSEHLPDFVSGIKLKNIMGDPHGNGKKKNKNKNKKKKR